MIYTKLLDMSLWWLITLLLLSFYITGGDSIGKYIQLLLTAVMAVLCVLRYGKNLRLHIAPFHMCMGCFSVFCFLSYFWAVLPEDCLHWALLVSQTLVCLSVVYIYADHQNTVLPLLDNIRWAGYLLTFYLFGIYGWSNLHYMLQESIRLDSQVLNANVVGMLAAFSVILTLYRWLFFKFSVWYIFAIPTFLLLSISASRKAFFILALGITAIFAIKYLKRNMIFNLINGFFFAIFGCLITYVLLSLPFFEGIKERLAGFLGIFSSHHILDESTYLRNIMLNIGFDQFIKTPLLGIGLGGSYVLTEQSVGWPCSLHNNYIELLTCGGIIGTSIYYVMYLLPGVQLFKQRYCSDKNTLICLVLLIIFLILGWGFVSYAAKESYFFILIFFVQVQLNLRHCKGKKYENCYKNN